jgi:hypothetical protein
LKHQNYKYNVKNVLCECEALSLTKRDKHRFRVMYLFFWVFPRRQIDAGEIPKRTNTLFKTRRKFEIKNRFRVFQNRMLRRTFGSKRKKWETKETYMKSYINLY